MTHGMTHGMTHEHSSSATRQDAGQTREAVLLKPMPAVKTGVMCHSWTALQQHLRRQQVECKLVRWHHSSGHHIEMACSCIAYAAPDSCTRCFRSTPSTVITVMDINSTVLATPTVAVSWLCLSYNVQMNTKHGYPDSGDCQRCQALGQLWQRERPHHSRSACRHH